MFLVHGEEKVRNGVLQWDVIVCANCFQSAGRKGLNTRSDPAGFRNHTKSTSPASSWFGKMQNNITSLYLQSLTVPDTLLRQRRTSYGGDQRRSSSASRRMSRPVTTQMSRKAVEIDASSDGSGTDYSDDEVLMLKKDDGFRPVKGQPGMYYKVCFSTLPSSFCQGNLK